MPIKIHIAIEDAQARFNITSLGSRYLPNPKDPENTLDDPNYELRWELLVKLCEHFNNNVCFSFATQTTATDLSKPNLVLNNYGPLASHWPSDPTGPDETPREAQMLRSTVAILPVATSINVNTASEPILQALFPDLPPARLAAFLTSRQSKPIDSIPALAAAIEPASLPKLDRVNIGFASSFFFVHISIKSDEVNYQAMALIHRDESANTHLVGIRQNTNMNLIDIGEDPQYWERDPAQREKIKQQKEMIQKENSKNPTHENP